ncbi:MAG TPA: hypothetical protein VMT35_04690, partial [Ignavibacteriaceae bacterium]|nr:hypothetical protein [Ignavibacteriaceae bacterium]
QGLPFAGDRNKSALNMKQKSLNAGMIKEESTLNSNANYENEIAQLKDMIYKRRQAPLPLKTEKEAAASSVSKKISEVNDSKPAAPEQDPATLELKKIFGTLRHRDVQKSTLKVLSGTLGNYRSLLNTSNAESHVLSSIASLIPTNKLKLERNKKAKKVALVGPTGVGKTTCIAKLSVISKLIHNLEIGLISIDTYRLGAIDQLKIFSEISNIELKVAYEAKEMPDIINKFRKKDLIFIDTAGRSQNNVQQLYEAKEFLNAARVDETYLVVSSTSSTKVLLDVFKKYKVYNFNSVIYTKIDEAVTFGNILNAAVKKNVPVSFLSNGQVIPDDIIAADSEFIANMIYTGKINK